MLELIINQEFSKLNLDKKYTNTAVWIFLGFVVFAFFVYASYCSYRGLKFNGMVSTSNS